MTAQIGDSFRFEGTEYSMVAISEPLKFNPQEYGITPESICTCCWDGFWCVYNITADGIFLEDLYINSKDDFYPEINGVLPLCAESGSDRFKYMHHHMYKSVNLRIPYTGKILVGDEFIRDYYIHMGYQRAWAYNVLVELVFENGILIETNDQSKIAAELREKISKDEKFEEKLYCNPLMFVLNSFTLDYGIKAWWLN